MGRILRAKRRNEEGFKSRFYTLVTRDTDEVSFSAKRRSFLVDQGYEFKVISDFSQFISPEEKEKLHYCKPADQLKMLNLIKSQEDSVGEDEIVEADLDDLAGVWQQNQIVKRNQALKQAAAAANKPKQTKKQHALFRSFRK